ncbi:CWF19-like protein 2 [Anneissia japonica]|uniref:CWF19-like protein 2 n=1 Tax=Anneissia japonica TaxID=1529436 RepID=UPI0014259686|nr:CWF19-like protein 2 [Anneissia japonica]
MSLISFESSKKLENERNEKRKRREKVLEQAKDKFYKDLKQKEVRKLRGEETWMLPSVNEKIDNDKQRMKLKKHKKEKKKHKKHKHKKKKKNDSSSSENSEDDFEEWVEKKEEPIDAAAVKPVYTVSGPPPSATKQTERDDWMMDPFQMNTFSRQDLRKEKNAEKEKEQQKRMSVLDNPGQSKNELNPFWKDGGSGLPEENPSKTKSSISLPKKGGDGGVWWLKQSYKRAVEQANEDGKKISDILAERFGSEENYNKMLAEAEAALNQQTDQKNDRRHGRERSIDECRRTRRDERDRERFDVRSRDKHRERDRDGYRERNDDRSSKRMSYLHGEKRFERSGNDRRHDRDRDERKDIGDKSRKDTDGSSRRMFLKPGDMDTESLSSSPQHKPMFKRPGEGIGDASQKATASYRRYIEQSKTKSTSQNWKDKSFKSPTESERKEEQKVTPPPASLSTKDSKREYSSSSSSGSADDSGSESDDSEERSPSPEPVRILTEEEMNQLGAKILRAELMGNEEQAAKLKAELEAARQAQVAQPKVTTKLGQSKDDPEDVVLTRMNKSGQCWPLPESEGVEENRKGKKRRKKVKLPTHGDGGERERYFADDDNFDLKTLVQREKMNRAEDQNMMLSRLAGRSVDKVDDEYHTLDDMFVSRAAQVESRTQAEEKEKARAIAEHKQMSAALSKCPFCIDSSEMKKHLIISLGTKVYLSVPATQSLTDGHCLLIPMQHTTAVTALDEDVWYEMQTFKRALVKMFESQDEDIIFLETAMNLRKQRHMCIECVPVPKEIGDMAPIYFKKAIMECGSEWSQNKKLVDTHQKGIRNSVPKGFPYFSVDFAMDGGFAHVIEDEHTFAHYFGKEIIGGMLDLEPRRWRNPLRENFDHQRRKVLQFADWWKAFDITNK